MNKYDIIKEYKTFLTTMRVKPEEFVLGAGGACLMHGLRTETGDMDMGLQPRLYLTMLKSKKYSTEEFRGTQVIHYNEYVDLHPLESGETVMIDGVCCYSLQRLLDQKLRLNRPKDQEDIKALKNRLKISEDYTTEEMKLNLLLNVENIEYRLDEWLEGKLDKLFVIGLSGSGKSTICKQISNDTKAPVKSTDFYLSARLRELYPNKSSQERKEFLFNEGVQFLIKDNPVKRIIFEGVQLSWLNPEELKNHAVLVIGASFTVSTWRAMMRDFTKEHWKEHGNIAPHEHIKSNLKIFNNINKIMNKLKEAPISEMVSSDISESVSNKPLGDRNIVRTVIWKNGMVLVCLKVVDGKTLYLLPGGGVEEGDTLEETAIKECLEEVGIKIKDVKDLNFSDKQMYKPIKEHRIGMHEYAVTHFFKGTFDSMDKSVYGADDDGMKYKWMNPLDAIKIMNNSPSIYTYGRVTAIQKSMEV